MQARTVATACFKDIALDKFVLRERHLKALLSAVDGFVSPSEFLKQRYVDWGIAEGLISVIPNGQPERCRGRRKRCPAARPSRSSAISATSIPGKGATVLLDAAKQLIAEGFDFELRVHGAAPFQSEAFVADIDRLFAETSPSVQRRGAYRREDIAGLISAVDCAIMPSIWWENAPLVIQEAQGQDCPVITSNIGGMAEMVEDGVNGLTVPPNDPLALAGAMRRIAEDADLRQNLALGRATPTQSTRLRSAISI